MVSGGNPVSGTTGLASTGKWECWHVVATHCVELWFVSLIDLFFSFCLHISCWCYCSVTLQVVSNNRLQQRQ